MLSEVPSWLSESCKSRRPETAGSPWPKPLARWAMALELTRALHTTMSPGGNGRSRSAQLVPAGSSPMRSTLEPGQTWQNSAKRKRQDSWCFALFIALRKSQCFPLEAVFVLNVQPRHFPNCKDAQRHKSQNEDNQQCPADGQHGIVCCGATNDTWILQEAAATVWMFVARHWSQSCCSHRGEAKLEEGSRSAGHFGDFPMIPLLKEESRQSIDQQQPGYTNWEDRCAQQVANEFFRTSIATQ